MRLVIEGEPAAKGRPRMTKKGGAYTPRKTREAEARMKGAIRRQWRKEPLNGPVGVKVVLYFKRPASVARKVQYRAKKPDIDNCLKSVLDAMNGICFADDKQVVSIAAVKMYGEFPRTEIMVERVSDC